jgi:hypothetical protein
VTKSTVRAAIYAHAQNKLDRDSDWSLTAANDDIWKQAFVLGRHSEAALRIFLLNGCAVRCVPPFSAPSKLQYGNREIGCLPSQGRLRQVLRRRQPSRLPAPTANLAPTLLDPMTCPTRMSFRAFRVAPVSDAAVTSIALHPMGPCASITVP